MRNLDKTDLYCWFYMRSIDNSVCFIDVVLYEKSRQFCLFYICSSI